MTRTGELRAQVIGHLEDAICGCDNDTHVSVDIITAKRAVELLKKQPGDSIWHYYMNEEGKARWKCMNCSKVCKRYPNDKLYCSSCGFRLYFES